MQADRREQNVRHPARRVAGDRPPSIASTAEARVRSPYGSLRFDRGEAEAGATARGARGGDHRRVRMTCVARGVLTCVVAA